MPKIVELTDLGLSYEQAAHGVQSAIAHKIESGWDGASPKHARVGIDLSKSDMFGLVLLLIEKGIITEEEYTEAMRRAVNHELALHEDAINRSHGGGVKLSFR